MRSLCILFALAVTGILASGSTCRGDESTGSHPAATLVADSGLPGGICVVAGCADAQLALSVAENERFVVHALFQNEGPMREARKAIRSRGVYGRVSADLSDLQQLPYADNLINMVVIGTDGRPPAQEVHRVLAPLGAVYVRNTSDALRNQLVSAGFGTTEEVSAEAGWFKATKLWPEEIDEWSHHLHAADGNPVADDRVVAPPRHYQWVSGPRWAQSHESDSNFRCLVTARGRIYYIVNEAPTSLAGPESPPDKWFLTAQDAFNGVSLWKVPIQEWGWREWKPSWFTPRPGVIPINLDKRVVAADDHLFVTMGYRAPVSKVDGRTGEVLKTYDGTAHTAEILHHDGRLILTVLDGDRAVVKSVDAESGRQRWTSNKDYGGTITDYYRFTAMRGRVPEAKVDLTLDIATDGRVVALLDKDSIAALDYDTGEEMWRTVFPLVEADHTAGRIDAHQKVWTGTMIVSGGVIVHASPNQLAGFSTTTGKILWKQPKKFLQHLWYEWKDVFVIDGLVWTWSAELAREKLVGGGNSAWPTTLNGYDLRTGKLAREVPLGNIFKTNHHHRCYRNKATVRYVLASRRGSEFVDIAGGDHSINNWVRGTCHMGMMPANGLQYAPPHPCQCYLDEKLNAMNALAGGRKQRQDVSGSGERLQKGPVFDTAIAAGDVDLAESWPAFRADSARSGSASTNLPGELKPLWRTKLGHRVGAPICVGERIFVPLVDEHQIVAVDAIDGHELWRFTAGARIDSPPTYDRGAILFGSADGCVYRVSADTGQLVWRFRAVPEDRRMAAFGQLESAWPVSGSVLVDRGPDGFTAYFAAGRSSHLDGGLRLCAIDAATGAIRAEKTLSGPSYSVDDIEQNYQLPMGTLPDIFRMEDASLFMRATQFNRQLEVQTGVPTLQLRGGFLDDAYFKRMPWSMGRSGHARLIVHDDTHAYCLRMFDSMQGLDPKVYFTPGKVGYLLYAHNLKTGKNSWAQRVPIRGRAMAVTSQQLCLAGPPDVVKENDPLASFEGRLGGVLRVIDKSSGQVTSEHPLSSPPVFNGAAAAHNRLILTLEDGSVVCFGE